MHWPKASNKLKAIYVSADFFTSYPAHSITGSAGYFLNVGSLAARPHR